MFRKPWRNFYKNYAVVFYMIYPGHVPYIECKMSLDQSASMRKIDCLSLVFIEFHVPELNMTSLKWGCVVVF